MLKDAAPGVWDMSCGGHVPTGETPNQTLKRELDEELGLKDVDFKFVERYLRRNPSGKQTELIYLYYAVVDKPVEEFTFSPDETQKLEWIDVAEAQSKYATHEVESTEFVVTQVGKILQKLFSDKL